MTVSVLFQQKNTVKIKECSNQKVEKILYFYLKKKYSLWNARLHHEGGIPMHSLGIKHRPTLTSPQPGFARNVNLKWLSEEKHSSVVCHHFDTSKKKRKVTYLPRYVWRTLLSKNLNSSTHTSTLNFRCLAFYFF